MTALQKIQIDAKKLRKAKPSMKYIDAIKEASKSYNAAKLGMVKKVEVLKKVGAASRKKAPVKMPVTKIVTTTTKEKPKKMGAVTVDYMKKTKLIEFTNLVKSINVQDNIIKTLKGRLSLATTMKDKTFFKKWIVNENAYFNYLKKQKIAIKKFI